MLYRDYIKLDLDYLKENSNFTDSEWQYLLLKTKEKTNFMIESEMHISKTQVDNLAARVYSERRGRNSNGRYSRGDEREDMMERLGRM